jgi:MFS family permease
MRRLLALRNARLLLIGQTLSLFGDTAMFLVLAIWVKTLTNSNSAAGLVFFFLALPALAAPFSGLIVDRVRRKPLMIATDLLIGAVVLSLYLVHDRSDLWLIYAVTVLYGMAGSLFFSAQSALMTVMLPDDLLGEGNGVLQTVRQGLRLVSPLVGAGLFTAFGGGVVAGLDAATFAASALCLTLIRVDEPPPHPAEHHFLSEVSVGVRHVFHTPALRYIVLTVGLALLVIGFTETLIFAVVSQGLHRPPSFLGVLSSFQGVGAIVGGLTAARMLRRVGDLRLVGLGLALFGLGDSLLITASLPVIVVGAIVAGAGLPWAIVAFGTALQQRTPTNLQGRVFSAADAMVGTPQIISIALGAAVSTLVDYRLLLAMVSLVTVACAVILFSAPAETRLPASRSLSAPEADLSA